MASLMSYVACKARGKSTVLWGNLGTATLTSSPGSKLCPSSYLSTRNRGKWCAKDSCRLSEEDPAVK